MQKQSQLAPGPHQCELLCGKRVMRVTGSLPDWQNKANLRTGLGAWPAGSVEFGVSSVKPGRSGIQPSDSNFTLQTAYFSKNALRRHYERDSVQNKANWHRDASALTAVRERTYDVQTYVVALQKQSQSPSACQGPVRATEGNVPCEVAGVKSKRWCVLPSCDLGLHAPQSLRTARTPTPTTRARRCGDGFRRRPDHVIPLPLYRPAEVLFPPPMAARSFGPRAAAPAAGPGAAPGARSRSATH
jgi:hypothetical protein